MIQSLDPIDEASGLLPENYRATKIARVKEDYIRLKTLHGSPKCYMRVRQFAKAMRNLKDKRSPSKCEASILGTMKFLTERMRDTVDGIVTLSREELMNIHDMSMGQVTRHLRLMKDRGLVISHNLRTIHPTTKYHTITLRLEINVEKYMAYFEPSAGVVVDALEAPKKIKVKKVKAVKNANESGVASSASSSEPDVNIDSSNTLLNYTAKKHPGDYFETDDILPTDKDPGVESSHHAEPSPLYNKNRGLLKASPLLNSVLNVQGEGQAELGKLKATRAAALDRRKAAQAVMDTYNVRTTPEEQVDAITKELSVSTFAFYAADEAVEAYAESAKTAKPANPAKTHDAYSSDVETTSTDSRQYLLDTVLSDVLKALIDIDHAFSYYKVTDQDLRNLNYHVHRAPTLELRATVARVKQYAALREHPADAYLAGCASDDSAAGVGYLKATLPFIMKNWGKIWKTCQSWIHADVSREIVIVDNMAHPEVVLNSCYRMKLQGYHAAQVTNPTLPLDTFLCDDNFFRNTPETTAIDRLYTMFMVGHSYPAVIEKYADTLMNELEREPYLLQGLVDQGAPVMDWLSYSKFERPDFVALAQDLYARSMIKILEAKDYGSLDLPNAASERPTCLSAAGGQFIWEAGIWYPVKWERENRKWVRHDGQCVPWTQAR